MTGDPEFAFSITSGGSAHARATYISATENRVVFEYTVSTTDDDSDGIWIGDHTDTLRLDGDDTIVGVSNGRTAVLDHQEVGNHLASHRIDQNPRIVTVALTSDPTHGSNSDTYAPGEVIEFTATFNQEVNVAGDPEFEFSIDTGSTDERAAYHSGSTTSLFAAGAKAIVFRYTILAADNDPSGIWIGDQTRTFKLDADDTIRAWREQLPGRGVQPRRTEHPDRPQDRQHDYAVGAEPMPEDDVMFHSSRERDPPEDGAAIAHPP